MPGNTSANENVVQQQLSPDKTTKPIRLQNTDNNQRISFVFNNTKTTADVKSTQEVFIGKWPYLLQPELYAPVVFKTLLETAENPILKLTYKSDAKNGLPTAFWITIDSELTDRVLEQNRRARFLIMLENLDDNLDDKQTPQCPRFCLEFVKTTTALDLKTLNQRESFIPSFSGSPMVVEISGPLYNHASHHNMRQPPPSYHHHHSMWQQPPEPDGSPKRFLAAIDRAIYDLRYSTATIWHGSNFANIVGVTALQQEHPNYQPEIQKIYNTLINTTTSIEEKIRTLDSARQSFFIIPHQPVLYSP